MGKCVLLLEDDADLARLVRELLEDFGYQVVHVTSADDLMIEAARRSPCVGLVDSTNPRTFDQWHLGPRLAQLGVPPVAFTAHASAIAQFEADAHDYVGIVAKPFDADEFLEIVNAICWEEHEAAVS